MSKTEQLDSCADRRWKLRDVSVRHTPLRNTEYEVRVAENDLNAEILLSTYT